MRGQRSVRKIKWWIIGFIAVVGVTCGSTGARAHGLGIHVAGGQGENEHHQFGFSWDTAVAEDRVFNYRLNLGYEQFELDDDFGGKEKFDGWILENTFGFQLFANEKLRLWSGPQIVTGLYENDLGLGLGFSLGANFHVSEASSLGLTLGVRRSEYSGILGASDHETVGYLRLDVFFRTGNDRFRPND